MTDATSDGQPPVVKHTEHIIYQKQILKNNKVQRKMIYKLQRKIQMLKSCVH